jgi:hypothetical protein
MSLSKAALENLPGIVYPPLEALWRAVFGLPVPGNVCSPVKLSGRLILSHRRPGVKRLVGFTSQSQWLVCSVSAITLFEFLKVSGNARQSTAARGIPGRRGRPRCSTGS